MPSPNPDSLFLEPGHVTEIITTINTLATSSGVGMDGFSSKIIKNVISCIAEPLIDICNSTFISSVFPVKLKHAKVDPIFKNDEKLAITSYRPISILPIIFKILEKLMHSRMMSFFYKHHVLSDNQYGFREHHSTYMLLLNIKDQISQEMDNNNFSIGIFLDLCKAFDTIDHSLLLKKLEIYGVRGNALHCITSYLSDTSKCVSIDGVLSNPEKIICGVPQGSVLGPLLFILNINDIGNVSNILKLIMFADDTNGFASHKKLINLFQL